MDWPTLAATGLGSAWLSGINLYATVLALGLLQRFGLARLPGDLGYLSEGWVIGLAALLYLVEFVADKVPAVDSIWDAVHTFIRVPAGAILAASAFADFDTPVRVAALLVGGGLALGAHGFYRLSLLKSGERRVVEGLTLAVLVPFSEKERGMVRGYRIGTYLAERVRGRTPPPEGFLGRCR